MDFDLPAETDPRRLDVRAWFENHPKPSYRQMTEAGYVVPHWPRPWGLAADAELQLIIDEEIKRAGITAPNLVNPVAINNCAVPVVGTHLLAAIGEHLVKGQKLTKLSGNLSCHSLDLNGDFRPRSGYNRLSCARICFAA